MNLLERALESTEKYGWCPGVLRDQDGAACVEGHIVRAHGHTPEVGQRVTELFDKDGCPECGRALLALHAGGGCTGGCTPGEGLNDVCVFMWNDNLSMPSDEAVYRDTLLRGAKLLDEIAGLDGSPGR